MTNKWEISGAFTTDGIHAELTESQKHTLANTTPQEREDARRRLYEIFKRDAENNWCKTLEQ